MIMFRFTVTARNGAMHVEWLEFASHFEANSYGMRCQGEGRPYGLNVYWAKL